MESGFGKDGAERNEQLFQLFLTSRTPRMHLFNEEGDTGLRLAVRRNASRIRAAQTMAQGGGNALVQTLNSHGKALTMLGALLFINVLILFFLMHSGSDWRFDVK